MAPIGVVLVSLILCPRCAPWYPARAAGLSRPCRGCRGDLLGIITEFDSFLPPSAKAPEEASQEIVKDIAESRHYENKVSPLYLAGGDKEARVLVQLVRDQPTSYDAEYGASVATVRHEVWQYVNRSGDWVKEEKTEVLDRDLLAKNEFRCRTWVWGP